jgi:YVTN family beta-propeller protein
MADLPTGTVTFLFTDIEGSTRLVQQLRERWADVLADQQRLLRDAFERHGGQEIDTQGDSFFVAFSRAQDAVAAAVDSQRALTAQRWPEGCEVRVRMGLHTGEAAVAGGRYLGLSVHRAARIASAGHGEQILVSGTTRDLVEDELPPDQSLRDLGEHELKDLPRPERLHQLVVEGLRKEFPPPKTAAPDPWDFAGREQELAEEARRALAGQRRRYRLLIAALAVIVTGAATAVVLVTRGESGIKVAANAVGIINPASNKVVRQVAVGARPGAITVGRRYAWVANTEDETLSRIDTSSYEARTVSRGLEGTPTDIASGREGVWIVYGGLGSVARVEPEFLGVSKPISVTARGNTGSIAVGEGSVWAVFVFSTVSRIDPKTSRVIAATAVGGTPSAIAVGAGSVWVANRDNSTVTRINPRTNQPVGDPINVAREPRGIAVGAGSVWVTSSARDRVFQIDPSVGSVETISVGGGPTGIAVGAGAVWVANSGDGTVSRIDPAKSEVVETIKVGNRPERIAVGAGKVWVTVDSS